MRKNIFLITIICLSYILSSFQCNKENLNSGGSFIINGNEYKVTSTMRSTSVNLIYYSLNSFNDATLNLNAINFYFAGTVAPSSGTYNIVTSSVNLGPNDVFIMATEGNGTNTPTEYDALGGGIVKVSYNNNKAYIKMDNTSFTNNAIISADVNEK